MCGGGSKAEKPTPPPTTNLVAVDPTEGTQRRRNHMRHMGGYKRQGATMLTQSSPEGL